VPGCDVTFEPSPANPATPKSGDRLSFTFNPQIVYPCSYDVVLGEGCSGRNLHGSLGFDVDVGGDVVKFKVVVWCRRLLPDGNPGREDFCHRETPFSFGTPDTDAPWWWYAIWSPAIAALFPLGVLFWLLVLIVIAVRHC
jgi:hypothetical protein